MDPINTTRSPVNLRSVVLGLLGVVLICAVAPFNDYVLNNSVLIGGSLPIAAVLYVFILAVFVNGPLNRFGRRSLTTGEMMVILVMVLVACCIPTSGLMRFWPASLVGPWNYINEKPEVAQIFSRLQLPDWFWPTMGDNKPADPIVSTFYSRIDPAAPGSVWVQTWMAWLPPTLGWGVFLGGMAMALVGLSIIVAKQWTLNERVAFPIAQVQMSLIQQPSPGRWLNDTLRSPAFLWTVALILLIRALQGLHQYNPIIPSIPVGFDLTGLFVDQPLSFVDPWVRYASIYFLVVGLSFFAASRISFSLWACMILFQFVNMGLGSVQIEMNNNYRRDINLGSLVAFAIMIAWTGRHFYLETLKRMFFILRTPSTDDAIVSPRTAGWIALIGTTLAIAWLMLVAMSFAGAVMLVLGLLITWVVMANVVAHSGLPTAYALSGPREWSLWTFQNADPAKAYSVTDVGNQFLIQKIGGMWAYASDQLGVYATHSAKLAQDQHPKPGRKLLMAIAMALVVGFAVSQASSLFIYYKYSASLDEKAEAPLNKEVVEGQPYWTMGHTYRTHKEGLARDSLTIEAASRSVSAGLFTGLLAVMQLRYNWWPLHPIGFLMLFSFSMKNVWFSIFLGWLIKAVVVKYGGGHLLNVFRPIAMGLILGDVLASGGFGLVALILNLSGMAFKTIKFMPVSQF